MFDASEERERGRRVEFAVEREKRVKRKKDEKGE